ncbi:thimet oligopeptidase [Dyella sp. OK004]|uniref:M3 family metallopeptidase n=1 Tax=Dyella sp. OK004 TaxID=1855292 RepID=UPI0008E637E0|nr:M3 family metallopeptidase [Dyella sp. OK004]SFR92890.1 thimet oligopeptidase [Dyella sp. OK004]
MKTRPWLGATFALLVTAGAQAAPSTDPLHGWTGGDSASLDAWVHARMDGIKAQIAKLHAVQGQRTIDNTLVPYDEALNQLALAFGQAHMLNALSADKALRDKGEELQQTLSSVDTDITLDVAIYQALRALSESSEGKAADPATRHYLDHSLLEFRLAGVDRDAATREHIRQLRDRIAALELSFSRHVQEDKRTLSVTPDQLAGMPSDFIAQHKPDASGHVILTTDQPDVVPVAKFASHAQLRNDLTTAYLNRGWPANDKVLRELLQSREALAHLLKFDTYADLAMADQMIGSKAGAMQFLDRLQAAAGPAADREAKLLRDFVHGKKPDAHITRADFSYWQEQYRKAVYDFDAQTMRPYFPFQAVQAGVLDTASRIFHVSFHPVSNAIVWHPSVTAFDVLDGQKKIGRIYLDMHPRDGKYQGASAWALVPGIGGRQPPEGVVVGNVAGGNADDPGLMDYGDVVAFFHDVGLQMQNILGSQTRWSAQSAFYVERDFIQAPSQMLEEFLRVPSVLQGFARHYKTGEVLPLASIQAMNRSTAYGRGSWLQQQMVYATYSLQMHDLPANKIDFGKVWMDDEKRFASYESLPAAHPYASFTYLTGYTSNYYTYLLDKVIAVDFFRQFDTSHPFDSWVAARYRQTVIEPGATRPAAELVKNFLGRPQDMKVLAAWINEEFTDLPSTAQQAKVPGP